MARVQMINGQEPKQRILEIGRIRKGDVMHENKDGKMIVGKDLDYFRVTWSDSPMFNPAWANEVFTHLYGDKPQVLTGVRFRTDNPLIPLESSYENWRKTGKGNSVCTRRCDGKTCSYQWSGGTEPPNRTPAPCGMPECGCKFTYRFAFWLEEFARESMIYGEFYLVAHSKNDYANIQPVLDGVAELGRLSTATFTLYRQDELITQPSGSPVVKSIVHLVPDANTTKALALNAGTNMPMLLPAPTQPIRITKEVVLQPKISIKQDDTTVFYRFVDSNGVVYQTSDSALVEAIVEDISRLKVDTVWKLEFSPVATIENDRIIELSK